MLFKVLFLFLFSVKSVFSIYCYQCVSTHPGCGLYDFDIRYYWSASCPDPNDKCVKIMEKKGADIIITRDCLSHLQGHRRDIPADHYEGCRESAQDPLLGHYVNSSIPELDIKRKFYDSVIFCFCDFDERCNGSADTKVNMLSVIVGVATSMILWKTL